MGGGLIGNVMMIGCRHAVYCAQCLRTMPPDAKSNPCPLCREPFTGMCRVGIKRKCEAIIDVDAE